MIAAVILAAGSGRRMGGPKALLQLEGETLLRRAARIALGAGCQPVVAVVGDWDPGLADLPVETHFNPLASEGMASSLRAGIAALPKNAKAVLILTVDQPAVDVALVEQLLALAATEPSRPAACAYAGTLGIPAIFPRRLFPALLAVRGDHGAKGILQGENVLSLPFPDGAWDLDTPEDLAIFRR